MLTMPITGTKTVNMVVTEAFQPVVFAAAICVIASGKTTAAIKMAIAIPMTTSGFSVAIAILSWYRRFNVSLRLIVFSPFVAKYHVVM